ncbi:MAG: YebC/PmpR family DNA-binding transcriptional regulator [bacterium]|nr:YebC/PmpR family DNA-binding transcriptional regulator [bacterium]
MSGHSKWSQIKHKKAATDAKKGQLFSKLVREIMIAARTGGPIPSSNIRLRTTIERARAQGLPKDNIERAIERASGEGEGSKLQEFLCEATATGGVSILIEGITDSKNRSIAEIKHILSDKGGKLADIGSVAWNFDKIGTLDVPFETAPKKEDAELAFIEAGADDFICLDDRWKIETNFAKQETVRQNLEQHGITIQESGHGYKPRQTITIDRDVKDRLAPLIEALLNQDDVQEIYTNLREAGI